MAQATGSGNIICTACALIGPVQHLGQLKRRARVFSSDHWRCVPPRHLSAAQVETIGDAYMVVGNLRKQHADHAARVGRFAIDAIQAANGTLVSELDPTLVGRGGGGGGGGGYGGRWERREGGWGPVVPSAQYLNTDDGGCESPAKYTNNCVLYALSIETHFCRSFLRVVINTQ